jgi:hypothetical protein
MATLTSRSFSGWEAQRNHVADSHHDVVGDDFDALGRETFAESRRLEVLVNLSIEF